MLLMKRRKIYIYFLIEQVIHLTIYPMVIIPANLIQSEMKLV